MALTKKTKRAHVESETDSETETIPKTFPNFLVLESVEDTPLTSLSPFIIEKVISGITTPKTVKKQKNGTLLVEVDNKRQAEALLKTKTFYGKKIKTYPHQTLNSSKGVVKSSELSLCTLDEIKTGLKSQGVTDVKRIAIRRDGKTIDTHTYILSFNTPKTPKEIKVGYTVVKVETFIPNPLRCFRCQKYGHHKDQCTGRPVCAKCGQKDPDHQEEECKDRIHCANCGGDHPAYAKNCDKWKSEREVMEVKHTRNIPFPEARKMVEAYSRRTTYARAVQGQPKEITESDKYKNLMEKLLKLGPDDWPKFIKEIRPSLEKNKPQPTPTIETPKIEKKKSETPTKTPKSQIPNQTKIETDQITTQNRYEALETEETENPKNKQKSQQKKDTKKEKPRERSSRRQDHSNNLKPEKPQPKKLTKQTSTTKNIETMEKTEKMETEDNPTPLPNR